MTTTGPVKKARRGGAPPSRKPDLYQVEKLNFGPEVEVPASDLPIDVEKDRDEFYMGPTARIEGMMPVPDPITFVMGEMWLNRPLYPRQATLIKCVFLREDLFTDFDYEVVKEWEESFAVTGDFGCPQGLLERMRYLRDQGHRWFKELILVIGRRGGKGYVSALCMSYVLWNYLAKWDPQGTYNIIKDKRLACLIYAGRKEQARDNLYRDLVQVIQGSRCFAPFIGKSMGESLSLKTPADIDREKGVDQQGKTLLRGKKTFVSGLDEATIKIEPLPATPMSGRGPASCIVAFDEMANMVATGANRGADEVFKAATPSLRQFGVDAFVVCVSSPWEKIGQFYVEWEQSQEIDPDTGEYAYPDKFMLQLPCWEVYEDWDDAHKIPLFPADMADRPPKDPIFGTVNPYSRAGLPPAQQQIEIPIAHFPELFKSIQPYDADLKRIRRADPEGFAVEYESKWQTARDAYFNQAKIDEMFTDELELTTVGTMNHYYSAHADPAFVKDNFGIAVGHTVKDAEGFDHVVFDYLHHWVPTDFAANVIDYHHVQEEIWKLIRSFPLDALSFDQHQSQGFLADLTTRAREAGGYKETQISIINENAPWNLKIAETFRIAMNQGWLHCFASETEFMTPDGIKRLGDVAGTSQKVLDSSAEWVDAEIKAMGIQPLQKITLTRSKVKKTIYATAGHRWFVIPPGMKNASANRRETLTSELQPGMRLAWMKHRSRLGRVNPSAVGIQAGIVYGDGTKSRRGSWVDLNGDKDAQLLKWFPMQPTAQIPVEEGRPSRLRVKELPKYFKDLPPVTESAGYLYGWLAGYFAADGSVGKSGCPILASHDLQSIKHVQQVCDVLGIAYGSIMKKKPGGYVGSGHGYELTLHRQDLSEDFFLIEEHRRRFVANPGERDRMSWVVESVEETDRLEEVYCAVVPGTASFTLDGHILTGNCPMHAMAKLELEFLSFKNGKVVHQTMGPVQHDDIARSMMEVTYALLSRQVASYMMGETQLTPAMQGGATPWMNRGNDRDEAILSQFSQTRGDRYGGGAYNPARGLARPVSGGRRGSRF